MWTDDPLADFERYDAEQERRLARLPLCSVCGEHIQDEEAYFIGGRWICEDCIDSFKQPVDELY